MEETGIVSSPHQARLRPFGRGGDGIEEVGDHGVGVDPLGLGVEGGDDPVAEDGAGDVADVGDGGVDVAFEHGAGLGAEDQRLAGAGAGAPGDVAADEVGGVGLTRAAGADEVAGVFEDVIGHGDAADKVLDREDLLGGEDDLRVRFEVAGGGLEDGQLLNGVGIRDLDVEHEPVELRLGERISPLLLDRVLGGEDEEGVRQANTSGRRR